MFAEIGKTLVSFTANKLDFLVEGAYDFVDVRDVVAGWPCLQSIFCKPCWITQFLARI